MKNDHRAGPRTSPAFQILRQFLVRTLASQKVPTVDIAKKLGISRSFAIKQAVISLKARTPDEKRILKLAREHENAIRRAGLIFLTGGEDIVTELAGGERAKLGPLAERRAKRAKAEAKKPATPTKAKPAPKKAKTAPPRAAVKEPTPTKPEGGAKRFAKPTGGAPKKGEDKEKKRERDRARRERLKAANLKAPVPAQPLKTPEASADEVLDGLGLGATPDPAQPI